MPGIRKRGEEIRDFILANIGANQNVAVLTAQQFGISLPAVYKHIDRLAAENELEKKDGRYVLQSKQYKYIYKIASITGEDAVWENDIKKHFSGIPANVRNIWIYGFMEIFNNAIEHSKGKKIHVVINENRQLITMTISDDGIGIFNNIKEKYNLADEKDALIELAKGKRTTDSARHSGQGIFFTSKAFDDFRILSNGIIYTANSDENSQVNTGRNKFSTFVYMRLASNSNKILKSVFDEYSTTIPGDFDRTIVPVHLAKNDDLVSRSQARRILSGLELFKEVILDFSDIEYIGQAFADEIFRVFINMNPSTVILAKNANSEVINMINRAKNTRQK